jgi:hypothetical protein
MTTETTDTQSPSPATQPLALKLNEGLGVGADEEIRQLSALVQSLDAKLAEYERADERARTIAVGRIAPLKNSMIDAIAEGMPGGADGLLKTWGWRQFARAIEAAHGISDA